SELCSSDLKPIAGEVNIACVGTYHCEIARIDQTRIISSETHEPINPTMLVKTQEANGKSRAGNKQVSAPIAMDMTPLSHKNAIKIVPLSASAMPGLTNYYARVTPAKREVQINFYPENNLGYVERFEIGRASCR